MLVNGSVQKTLAAILLFLIGLGSLGIVGYQIAIGVAISPIAMTFAGIIVSFCLHQLGYSTGASTSNLTTEVATQLNRSMVNAVIQAQRSAHQSEDTQGATADAGLPTSNVPPNA